jgi:hypothetical protein
MILNIGCLVTDFIQMVELFIISMSNVCNLTGRNIDK